MKKSVIIFSLLAVCALWTCKEKENPVTEDPEIVLSTPSDGASFDLSNVSNISFGWTDVEGIDGYQLVVSLTENLASPQTKTVNANPFSVSASDFDAMAAAFNVSGGETVTLYWSVRPSDGSQTIKTQVRTIVVTRLPKSVIVLPETNNLTIDANDYESFAFTWTPVEEVTGYVIMFGAANDNLSLSFDPTGTNSFEFTDADAFDAMLADLGLDFGESQTVYWTVEPGVPNSEVVSQVRQFTGIRKSLEILLIAPIDLLEIPAGLPANANVEYTMSKLTFDANNAVMVSTAAVPAKIYSLNWIAVPTIPDYTIRFALDAQKLNSVTDYVAIDVPDGETTFKFASLEDFDNLLEQLGMDYEESRTVYWTVAATGYTNWPVTQTGKFIGIRKFQKAPLQLSAHQVTGGYLTGGDPTQTTPAVLFNGEWSQTYLGGGDGLNSFVYPWAYEVNYTSGGSSGGPPAYMMPDGITPYPMWLTFKTEQPVKLAKYRHHHYWGFRWTTMLFWELWAYTGVGEPVATVGWDDWEKIGEGDTDHLPVESAANQNSRIDAYLAGESIVFPATVPTAQYYRIKCIDNWHWKNRDNTTVSPAQFASFTLSEIICWAQ